MVLRIGHVRRSAGLLPTLLAPGLLACDSPLDVEDQVPFDPPPVYRVWWQELEVCAELAADFEEVRWFTGESVVLGGRDAFGVWSAPNTIYLKRFYVTSEPAVKHEMLHHITSGSMPHSHPDFGRCGAAPRAPSQGRGSGG